MRDYHNTIGYDFVRDVLYLYLEKDDIGPLIYAEVGREISWEWVNPWLYKGQFEYVGEL